MNKTLIFLLSLLLFASEISAQFQFAGKVTNLKKFDNRIELTLDNARVNIYVYDSNVIRFRYTNKKRIQPGSFIWGSISIASKNKFQFYR